MTAKLGILSIVFFLYNHCFSQEVQRVIGLTKKFDSSFYDFTYIQPQKNIEAAVVPNDILKYYTLSRYINLPSINQQIPVLIGVSKNGIKLIIFDENHNRDFTDDSIHYFIDTVLGNRKFIYKTKTLTLENNITVTFDYNIIKPDFINIDLRDSLENNIFFEIRPDEYRVGELIVNNKKVKIFLFADKLYTFNRMYSNLIFIPDGKKEASLESLYKYEKKYKFGDKLKIENNIFLIKSIAPNGETLVIENLSDSNTEGVNAGFVAPFFDAVSIKGKILNLKNLKGQYILLDFWGTWCGPCKMVLPDLKTFQQKFPKLKMIGVALDNDINQVRQFVKNGSINWEQVFVDKNKMDNNSLCAKYNVENYPTFILINPEGEIVFRDIGVDGFGRLKGYLDKSVF